MENYSNPISIEDYFELLEKYPSFITATATKKAIKNGIYVCEDQTVWYYTRFVSGGILAFVGSGGNLVGHYDGPFSNGLRITLQTKYTPNSILVKSCRNVTRTTKLFCDEKHNGKITSTAPIVTFGEKDYIWLNKNECEKSQEKTMRLISVELLDCVKFDESEKVNDYGDKATLKLRQKCEFEALEFATEEEKQILVKVRLTDEDRYANAIPILE